jgi:oxazoline/thiazoline synthase
VIAIPRRPAFKAHFHPRLVPGVGVALLAERTRLLLEGPLYAHVAPLLDGRLTSDEIVDRLAGTFSAAEVYYAILRLRRLDLVAEAPQGVPPRVAAFWHSLDADAAEAAARLARTSVAVVDLVGGLARQCGTVLRRTGIKLHQAGDATVVLTSSHLHPALDALNDEALRSGRPWVLARPLGAELWIGPLFVPCVTCCWRCLVHRLGPNSPLDSAAACGAMVIRGALHSTVDACLGLLATQLACWLGTGANARLAGAILTLDPVALSRRRHAVPRWPMCPACGGPGARTEARGRHPRTGAPARETAPPRTAAAFVRANAHLVSPLTGILKSLTSIPFADGLVHVCVAVENVSSDPETPSHTLPEQSSGVGRTASDARAGALAEAAERFSGRYRGDEPCVRASLRALGAAGVHPNCCMMFSEPQLRASASGADGVGSTAFVPRPFDPERVVSWTPLRSLTRDTVRYLPTEYLYYGSPVDHGAPTCVAESNGNAAGATAGDAIRRGLLELIERDSVAIWWYNRLRRPAVDLTTVGGPFHAALAAFYASIGREYWVLDITTDLGVPSFAAVSRRTDPHDEQITLGFGASVDPDEALLHATLEMAKMTALLIARGDDDRADSPDLRWWLRHATVASQSYLRPACARRCSLAARRSAVQDASNHLDVCRRLVEARGMEVLVLDQTREDVGIPVAKVVVPGLRPFWPRFAPGRLYDVPVAQGALARPRLETQLNPVPMFL